MVGLTYWKLYIIIPVELFAEIFRFDWIDAYNETSDPILYENGRHKSAQVLECVKIRLS